MQKVLKFKLTNKTLPLLPNLKHNMAKEVKMEGDNLIITLAVQTNPDYINDLVGFSAKQVEIKTNLLDDADCDVEIYKVSHKKMLKEKSKLGYGKKGNVYAIRDFLRLYKDYPLEYAYSLVGNGKAHLIFNGKAGIEIAFKINCSEMDYIFSE